MYDRVSIDDLVSFEGFPQEVSYAVQQAALAHPRGRDALYGSTRLDPRTWESLWSPSLPVAAAAALVSRPLTAHQIAVVLGQESRVRVLAALLESNSLTAQELSGAFSPECSSSLVPVLLRQPNLPVQWRKQLLARSRPDVLAESMLFDGGLFSDDEVVDFLTALPPKGWYSYQDRSLLLQGIFFTRPAVLAHVVQELPVDSPPFTAAAGSPRLAAADAHVFAHRATESDDAAQSCRFALLAFVHNPVVDSALVGAVRLCIEDRAEQLDLVDVVASCDRRLSRPLTAVRHESVASADEVEWLIRRAAPRDYAPRPLEVLLLLENENLGPEVREQLLSAAWYHIPARWEALASPAVARELASRRSVLGGESHPPAHSPAYVPPARAALLEAAAAELGSNEKNWENLVLLMDDFSGSFAGLVQAASRL